jgi:hypothetical protein
MGSSSKGRTSAADLDIPVGTASLSIDQFCRRHGISRGKYFDLRRAGLGPVEMRLGPKLVRITAEADIAWQHAREHPIGSELTQIEHAKTELAARGSRAGTAAAASPRHISNQRRRKSGGAS